MSNFHHLLVKFLGWCYTLTASRFFIFGKRGKIKIVLESSNSIQLYHTFNNSNTGCPILRVLSKPGPPCTVKKNELLCGHCTEISASMWALYRKGTSTWHMGFLMSFYVGIPLPPLPNLAGEFGPGFLFDIIQVAWSRAQRMNFLFDHLTLG